MSKFHKTIYMPPTKCQMQIINRHFPYVIGEDCEIERECGSHVTDGRDYIGTFCVHIYRKGRFVWDEKKMKKEY